MLDTTKCTQYLETVKAFAEKTGQLAQLQEQLDYLHTYGGDETKTRTVLRKDFAPYSFEFTIFRPQADGTESMLFFGGLLYHGPHDGNGSGVGPTYAVTLEPTTGWSIHT